MRSLELMFGISLVGVSHELGIRIDICYHDVRVREVLGCWIVCMSWCVSRCCDVCC